MCEKKERKRGERARINESRKWNIRTFLKGRSDSHFPLVLARIRVSLALVSLSLSFSDSVITRVYYILLLEDGLLFAFSASLSIIVRVFLSQRLFLSLSFSLSFCYYVKFYSDSHSDSTICNSPPSYRQPSGNGQLLSRRYCKHSVWLFSCASKTAT